MGLANRFNHTSGITIVTPTDHPKSVCNRCVIEAFGGVFVLSRRYLDLSVGVGAYFIGLSHISSFFFQWRSCVGHSTASNTFRRHIVNQIVWKILWVGWLV